MAILIVTGVGGVSSFVLLNRYATGNRDRSTARALCQERIEQVLTLPFTPQTQVMPVVTGQDNQQYYLLGTYSNYNTASNAYTGPANQQTSNEPVTIYKQPDGTSLVTGTRTTTVTSAGINGLVSVTVTVTYTVRGQPVTYSLSTLRSVD